MLKKGEMSEHEKSDIQTLMKFVRIFCQENHDGEKNPFSFKLYDIKEIDKKSWWRF
jgi:hypothetical protein